MTNLEIARVLKRVADLLELQGADRFRTEAYRRAAQSIEASSENVVYLHDRDSLQHLPGIGPAIAAKVEELIETGRLAYLERLESQIPAGLAELLEIHGLGPKRVRTLWQTLNITSLEALEAAARTGKLRGLPGMGVKTEENILKGIERYRAYHQRVRLGDALPFAEHLLHALREAAGPSLERLEIAGSIRRRAETVGDLNWVASTTDPDRVMEAFLHLPQVRGVRFRSATRGVVSTSPGIGIELRLAPPHCFGALLQYATGSKSHNLRLAERAQRRGLLLNEQGLFQADTGHLLECSEEESALYHFLELPYIPPELREDRGEIEAADCGELPQLVEMSDIRGDFHAHTQYSDGASTIAEMADAAREMGYEWLALTDHSPSLEVARGLSVERLLERAEIIDDYNARTRDFRLLNGTESDIHPDGSLDYPDDVLEQLDVVIASVHSRFSLSQEEMTRRVVNAIKGGRVDILGHATGRLINRREPYALDLEQVFEAAKEVDTAIEINAFPDRLDLRDVDARAAKAHGLHLAIGSDAHHARHLPLLRYGVYTARRAWLEPKDVLNTRSASDVLRYFRRRKQR